MDSNIYTDGYSQIRRILVHVTGKCNLRCKHCYASYFSRHELQPRDIDRILKLALLFGKPIDVSGGEPFTSDLLEYLIKRANKNNINISSIFSNGTLISNVPWLGWLKLKFPNLIFYLSLDGCGKTHDEFRGAECFEVTLSAAKLLKKHGFFVSINTMLHNSLSDSNLHELYKIIKRNQFDRWRVDTPFNGGKWQDNKENYQLLPRSSLKVYESILSWMLADNLPCEFELNHTIKYIDGTFYFMDTYSINDPICPCKLFVIWPDGKISWCQNLHREKDIIGSIYDDHAALYTKYAYYKKHSIYNELMEHPNIYYECANCKFLLHCGLGCRSNNIFSNGNYSGIDHEICQIYKDNSHESISKILFNYLDMNESK